MSNLLQNLGLSFLLSLLLLLFLITHQGECRLRSQRNCRHFGSILEPCSCRPLPTPSQANISCEASAGCNEGKKTQPRWQRELTREVKPDGLSVECGRSSKCRSRSADGEGWGYATIIWPQWTHWRACTCACTTSKSLKDFSKCCAAVMAPYSKGL